MKPKRIIPCMDIKDGKIVKGVQFEGIQEVEDPVKMAAYYSSADADELVFYDITASMEQRGVFEELFRRVAGQATVPLTLGGGIASVKDVERALQMGAAKVSINSGEIAKPGLVADAVREFGSGKIVFAVDVKQVGGSYQIFTKGGRESTGMDAVEWVKRGADAGAGELVINSIDTDGVRQGFDLPLLARMAEVVDTPIVASGGAGTMEDFATLFLELPKIDAGLAASVFHFGTIEIPKLKEYLASRGIPVIHS